MRCKPSKLYKCQIIRQFFKKILTSIVSNKQSVKMSLFPIINTSNESEPVDQNSESSTWLKNDSFKPPETQIKPSETKPNVPSTKPKHDDKKSNKDHEKYKKKHKKSKHKHKSKDLQIVLEKSKTLENKIDFSSEDFCVDKEGEKIYLLMPYLSKKNAPRFKYNPKFIKKHRKSNKIPRYFSMPMDVEEDNSKDRKTEKEQMEDNKWTGQKQEEDLMKTTAFYNKSLEQDPYDINMWLKYVQFQDVVYQYEKTYKRGSNVKGARVTAERKISILDKALEHNSGNEELLRERLLIAERVYPSDEMSVMMKSLVSKDPGNVIVWQGYIEATQCSMAHCSTPTVLEMYNKCLSNLHQLRRTTSTDKPATEAKILNILYQCGLFLRQAGLWEQMWTLLRLYLDLNLAPENINLFDSITSIRIDEKELLDLEEIILKSNLPSHELWLRIEKIREACHWLPLRSEEHSEDPQRLVFIEDVSDLIHPITCQGNTFRLIAIILNLLKVPLLPCRHTTMHELGLDYVPWALDALELLLPAFYPISSSQPITNIHLLKDILMFAVGPQYLRSHPGQVQYLEFVTNIFKNCSKCLRDVDQNAIYVWWFAFERLMIILDRTEAIKIPESHKKAIKSQIKDILKQEANRSNLLLYREYGLIEYELNKPDTAINILQTSISSVENKKLSEWDKTCLIHLKRTLCDILFSCNKQKEAMKMYTSIVSKHCTIEEAVKTFKEITNEMLDSGLKKLVPAEQFLPDYFIEWTTCAAWLIYLKENSPWDVGAFLETTINHCNIDSYRQEVLYEIYLTILMKHCREFKGAGIFKVVNDILSRAINLYPNNFQFMSILTQIEELAGCVGRSWWKLTTLLTESNHSIPRLFLILLASQRISSIEKAQQLSVEQIGGPVLSDFACNNRMLALFHRLTSGNSISKRCGLIWRLYLKFLYHRSTDEMCRNTYYRACEECPWLKALYIDAAIYIPNELPQIQDLLIEKQLRIHLTPEELEILRP